MIFIYFLYIFNEPYQYENEFLELLLLIKI